MPTNAANNEENIVDSQCLTYIYRELNQYKVYDDNNIPNCHLSGPTKKQIKLDCDRSFGGYNTINENNEVLYQKELYCIITAVLRKDANLHYYQGYHDIASLFLFSFSHCENGKIHYKICRDREDLIKKLFVFTKLFLTDFMKHDMKATFVYLSYIPKILNKLNLKLFKKLSTINQSYKFALPNIITLFNHDIDNNMYNHKVLVLKHLIMSSNISFVLLLYSILLNEVEGQINDLFVENQKSNDARLVLQFKVNSLVNSYLNNIPLGKFEALLQKTNDLMNQKRMQNIFKYSLKNRDLLINFKFDSEKNALIKLSILSVNLFILGSIQRTSSALVPASIITSVFSIYNIYKTVSS